MLHVIYCSLFHKLDWREHVLTITIIVGYKEVSRNCFAVTKSAVKAFEHMICVPSLDPKFNTNLYSIQTILYM